MRVEVRLFATLARYLPDDHDAGAAVLEVDEHSTVADVARALGIPAHLSRIALVNDRDATDDRPLTEGDVVTLFPPLAGGAAPRPRGDTLGRCTGLGLKPGSV